AWHTQVDVAHDRLVSETLAEALRLHDLGAHGSPRPRSTVRCRVAIQVMGRRYARPGRGTSAGRMNPLHPDGRSSCARIIRSHEANPQRAESRDSVTAGQAADRLGAVRPFVGDCLLALAVAIAAAVAASAATSEEPLRWLLALFAFCAASTLALRRVYPVTVL